MKKFFVVLLLVALLVPSTAAFAADGGFVVQGAPTKLMDAREKALDGVKPTAEKYGWDIKTQITESTSKKLYTDVRFSNSQTGLYVDLKLRVKGGKATWYCEKSEKWVKTTPKAIKTVLKKYGKKVKLTATKTLAEASMELFAPVSNFAADNGWFAKYEVTGEADDEMIVEVRFENLYNGYSLDVEIHATKTAAGTSAEWFFLSKDGTYKRSSSELIEEVLAEYAGKDEES